MVYCPAARLVPGAIMFGEFRQYAALDRAAGGSRSEDATIEGHGIGAVAEPDVLATTSVPAASVVGPV